MYRNFFIILLLLMSVLTLANAKQRKPKIVGQRPVSTVEEQPKTITVSDLIIDFEEEDSGSGDGDDDGDDDDEEEDDDGKGGDDGEKGEDEEDLTLEVRDGSNYSREGNTITPALNFSGILSVPVKIYNGNEPSNAYDLQLQVSEENDPPVITGQVSLQTPEEQPITLTLNDLIVSDPDNIYPDGFTMSVFAGTNYTVTGSTITPDLDFYGTLSVPVTVNDGTSSSNTFDVQIEITNVNDAPVITGQQVLQTNEDQALTLTLDNFTVTDIDNNYPDGFALNVSDGSGYSVSGTNVIPDTDFSGTLTVPVTVYDGSATSNQFTASITVNAVNDTPIITGQTALSTNEEQSFTIELTHLTVSDADNVYPDHFTLAVSTGTNYSHSGNTITPSPDFSGVLSVPVTVHDGTTASSVFEVQVTVNAVNDVPIITGQAVIEIQEDQSITLGLEHLTAQDPDDSYPDNFTLAVSPGDNYTVSASTITPATGFNGVLNVPVTINDGNATSASFTVSITVTPVNNPPVITGQTSLQTQEEQSITLSLADLTVTDTDNSYPTGFTMSASAGSNYTVSGLAITPAANFNGTLTVPVTVNDGISASAPFNLNIVVNAVNDVPVISGQAAIETPEEQPVTITFSSLSVTDPDNTYPSGFAIAVLPGSNYSVSGLTVTPAVDFNGTLSVPVTVHDGSLTSASFNLQIQVTAQNDPPLITDQTELTINEGESITLQLSHLIVVDTDNTFPNGFSLNISNGTDYTVSGTTITPASDFSGTLTVPVTVSDGLLSSTTFNISVVVVPLNDPPVITGQVALMTSEETALTIELVHLTVTDVDNTYPVGFSLNIGSGENYTVSGTTITPAANFGGTLSVPVTVSDGTSSSQPFSLQVLVSGTNDLPQITGQVELSTNEDVPLTITTSHLTVTDSDDTYPTGFSITASSGENYTVTDLTIVPAENFSGSLSVPVVVNDGMGSSNVFDLQITVLPVNDQPVITAHQALSTYRNKTITLDLSHLTVTDPDNTYPEGFTLTSGAGDNYSVFENTITPSTDFTGTLVVPVTVNDGAAVSETFNINIDVVAPPNVPPVITSQVTLTTFENQPLDLQLSHIVVTDPDNVFPDDFTMAIFSGEHYTISGNRITPDEDYSGPLNVTITVSDMESTSDPFNVVIQVIPVTDVPLITSQTFIRINEDDSLLIDFSHLTVLDPDNTYPTGFTLSVNGGDHYTNQGLLIKPEPDFSGYLSVPVTVNDGVNTSIPYQMLILVAPVNDAPVISEVLVSNSFFENGGESMPLFDKISISDVDDDTLSLAEVMFLQENFESGKDSLAFENTSNIRAVFDHASGLLIMFGKASIDDYQTLIRSVHYYYTGTGNPTYPTKTLSLTVSDGKIMSKDFERSIAFTDGKVALDIPTGFTPNGDGANDTWSIRNQTGNDAYGNARIRVFNKKGVVVFEATGLDSEWDGRMNGTLLPADSYFYTIDLNHRTAKGQYKGIVTILR